jgi:dTMP kinase
VLAAVVAVLLGFCAGVAWVTGYTILGLEVEDALRGRTFGFVQSLVRLVLALVLAAAPLLAGLVGPHRWRLNDDVALTYGGTQLTFLLAALLTMVAGVASFRQMNDRPGVSVAAELRQAWATRGTYAPRGVFVALEGGEGVGKTTQARLLGEWLTTQGYEAVLTHEPGDTEIGAALRRIVLDPATGELSPRTEALLYAADKAEHVARVVRPALDRGAVVVTDRYVDSTLAYQGAGRALAVDEVEPVARWATTDLRPHLTVLLDLPVQLGLSRVVGPDRIEQEPVEFHERVRQSFRALAESDPEHYLVVEAGGPPETVAALVRARVVPLLAQALRVTPTP